MPVTAQTLTQADSLRRLIGGDVDEVTRQLVSLWVNSWDQLYGVWYAAVADLNGQGWPGRNTVYQAVAGASAATLSELQRLTARIPTVAARPVGNAATMAAQTQPEIIRSQLPDTLAVSAATGALLAASVQPATPAAVAAVTTKILARLVSEVAGLDTGTVAAMRRTVAAGPHRGIQDPGRRTQTLLQRLEGVYNRSLTSTLASARTAVADAGRDATRAVEDVNRRILVGWQWRARRDPAVCPVCLSQDGREFPNSVPGPRSHPNCRCVRVAVVKPWRLLGIDLPEPPGVVSDAERWFWSQPEDVQLRIMGPGRLARLKSGDLTWGSLTRRARAGRRTVHQLRPLNAA